MALRVYRLGGGAEGTTEGKNHLSGKVEQEGATGEGGVRACVRA